jgi:hypothetical protein
MVESTAPDPKVRQQRFRILLVVSTAIALTCVFGYLTFAAQGVSQLERRIVAGEFENVRLETGSFNVATDGRVLGVREDRYVASLKLVPPGEYQATLVANDGNAAHIAKGEMVIAAQDTKGRWHPESAPQVLERLRSPRPGTVK